MNVYCLFNRFSMRYSDIMLYPTDSFAVRRLQQAINPQTQRPFVDFDEFELCKVGTFDESTGVLSPLPPVRVSWNVSFDKIEVKSDN